jgi:hypothetical protein
MGNKNAYRDLVVKLKGNGSLGGSWLADRILLKWIRNEQDGRARCGLNPLRSRTLS